MRCDKKLGSYHRQNSSHTCSLDGENYYCVYCLQYLTENISQTSIPVQNIEPKVEELDFNGHNIKTVEEGDIDHWRRIRNCDKEKAYPILVYQQEKNGPFIILDGCHRLAWRMYFSVKTAP